MPATRKSPDTGAIAPEERRDEVIAILAAGLVRLVGASPPPVALAAMVGPPTARASMAASTPTSMPAENLSESGEIGLELSGKTRLSVPAG
jgi:hypothetical protein